MNKLILLMLSLISGTLSLFAQQRSIDTELIVASPEDSAVVAAGQQVLLKTSIINHGPDSIRQGDSLYILYVLGSDIKVTRVAAVEVAPGSKLDVQDIVYSFPTAGRFSLCMQLLDDPTMQVAAGGFPPVTVSYKDPNTANNKICKTIIVTSGQTTITSQDSDTPQTLMLYPNPASANVMLYANMDQQTEIKIIVRDIAGRKVWQQDYDRLHMTISTPLSLDVSGLKSGLYFFELQEGDKWWIQKILIQ